MKVNCPILRRTRAECLCCAGTVTGETVNQRRYAPYLQAAVLLRETGPTVAHQWVTRSVVRKKAGKGQRSTGLCAPPPSQVLGLCEVPPARSACVGMGWVSPPLPPLPMEETGKADCRLHLPFPSSLLHKISGPWGAMLPLMATSSSLRGTVTAGRAFCSRASPCLLW